MNNIEKFISEVEAGNNIVFFGGAGVSTESGIPDFRSEDGLYSQHYDYPPETMLSHTFFVTHTREFFRFYRDKLIIHGVKPNITHIRLAQLEARGKLKAVVTQNIDGLHQLAGSRNVCELHGSIYRNHCLRCGKKYTLSELEERMENDPEGIPHCDCGGVIKPDVVLYEEGLDQKVMEDSVNYISHADMLVIGGTSLAVYPAAGLVNYFRGKSLVLINKQSTPFDGQADIVINESLGSVFEKIKL